MFKHGVAKLKEKTRQQALGRRPGLKNAPVRVKAAPRYTENEMIKIYSPNDEVELSMIRGLLDSAGVHFFVHNDHFGSMEVGPQVEFFNKKAIMVAPEDADRANQIIAEFLGSEIPEEDEITTHYSLGQKVRMILESLLFCWFIPGKKKRKRPES